MHVWQPAHNQKTTNMKRGNDKEKILLFGGLIKSRLWLGLVWVSARPPPPLPSVNNSDKQTNKLAQNTEKKNYDIA
jgi:hypothetical protein